MNLESRIYLAGHRGLVGSTIFKILKAIGYKNLIVRTSRELDLKDQKAVAIFFQEEKPEFVFLAAAKVGGIFANYNFPAVFIYENLAIQINVLHQAYICKVKKLLFLGSSCIYPRKAPQPMQEKHLLTGLLEPTNESYAIAKIAGIKMCQAYNRQYGTNFISVMPANLYGPGDNFDLQNSHVLPALIRKFHEAKITNKPYVEIWGSGRPRREFLYVDDLAEACIFLMHNYDDSDVINIGAGKDISVMELSVMIKEIVGYQGGIKIDLSKPDGMPRKLLNISKIESLGWKSKIDLRTGIAKTYDWFLKKYDCD